MKIAIHQPNFFPWYPFFEKIKNCDIFIILTHCQFEKNGFFTTRPYFFDRETLAEKAAERKYGAAGKKRDQLRYAKMVRKNLDDTEGLINFNFVEDDIGRNQRIHYFFMGDLIHTVLDCLYGKEIKENVYDKFFKGEL